MNRHNNVSINKDKIKRSSNADMKVPEGFFNKQRQEILDSVKIASPKKGQSIKMWITSFAAAAIFAVLGWSIYSLQNFNNTPCVTYSCLLNQIDFKDFSKEDLLVIEEWEDELSDEIWDETILNIESEDLSYLEKNILTL